MDTTRASLVFRLQDPRDVSAWDEFAKIYTPVIYRVAIKRGLQPADAENLVQEVMFAVARSVTQWLDRDARGRFRAWLLRIARNETVDMLTRRATRPLGRDGQSGEQLIAVVPAPSEITRQLDLEYDRIVFQWAADQVRDAVAEQTWLAFKLTCVDGMSVQDAAAQLSTRRGNIHFARSRVMTRIKDLAKQYEIQNEQV